MSNDNLKRLKGADRIRKQVNVDLGSNDILGVQQGLFEIVSNSIDRFRRGYGNYVEVVKNLDLSYEVRDYADGLPMDWNEDEQAYNWELAMRVPCAGGNYDHDSESLGQHGKGLSATLLSSKNVKVISFRNGYRYEVNMLEGRPLHKKTFDFICDDVDELFSKEDGLKVLKKEKNINNELGTHTIWTPDDTLFTDINIPIDWICTKLKKQAIVNSGLKIKIIDRCEDKEYEYLYENGILDYIQELNNYKGFTDVIHFSDKGRGKDAENRPEYDYRYEFALIFNNEVNLSEYYHNSSELLHGGSTADAIKKALVDVIHNYCMENNLYNKNEKKVRYADVSDSLLCIISSFSNRTSFTNQTKLAITNEFIKDFTTKSLTNHLAVYFIENKIEALKICNQILINKRSSEKAEKSRLSIKKKLSEKIDSISNRVEGLVDCKHHGEDSELYIAEGKSALGSIVLARNPQNQAVIPIRGKILNCLKANYDTIFKSEIITDLVKAIGCGIETDKKNKDLGTFDIKNLRYGKIMACADADEDGKQIVCLILTMIYRLMPTLIHEGRVYIVNTPLYEVRLKDDSSLYWNSESEKEEYLIKYGDNNIKHMARCKGLGEMTAEVMSETGMNPQTRNLTQVTIDDIKAMQRAFDVWMDVDVTGRKEIISTELYKYKNID